MITDREMILELGKALMEAIDTQNKLSMVISTLRKKAELSEAADIQVDKLITDTLSLARLTRIQAESAIDYGSRGKVIHLADNTRKRAWFY